jgi:8-oxo-dGTP diphosphatase
MNKTEYVLGFLFDDKKELVVLIEKQKPEWQKGFLNGVGGKVEESDSRGPEYNRLQRATTAMVREFKEESGVKTKEINWRIFAVMEGNDWVVSCFTYTNSAALSKVITCTNEKIYIIHVTALAHHKVLSNIPWIVPMALDENMGNHPFYATIIY